MKRLEMVGVVSVLVNGCFDVIHVGHVRLLEFARSQGAALIIGVNSDDSVRRLKGPGRPVNAYLERVEVLRALQPSAIICKIGDELIGPPDSPCCLIHQVRPSVFVLGDEPSKRDLPEERAVRIYGGRVVKFPYVVGRSTTAILQRGSR